MRGVLNIQCTIDDETGDFLVDSNLLANGKRVRITPVFSHLSALYDYLDAEGWEPVPDSKYPTGEYEKPQPTE